MRTIRIFVSSPSDVLQERDRARQVVEVLRRRYAGRLALKAVLWEDLPLTADMSFQHGIDAVLSSGGGIDVAVFVMWSRLGTPIGITERGPLGTRVRSGTEWEWRLMLAAYEASSRAKPRLLVYTREDQVSFDERLRGRTTTEQEEAIRQKRLAEQFIAENFKGMGVGASNARAHHVFDRPETFSRRFRIHLQEILDLWAGDPVDDPPWDVARDGSPFLGLLAYQERHAPIFFGREDEILEVRQALCQQARDGCAFVLIAGPSGSGKSSLVRAGVLPAVVSDEVDDRIGGWRSLVVTPSELGDDPITGLVSRLVEGPVLPELLSGGRTLDALSDAFRQHPQLAVELAMAPALDGVSGPEGRAGIRLLLVVDQLEELLSRGSVSSADRDAFLDALETFARSGRIWILATMRSDFFAMAQSVQSLGRLRKGRGQFDLLPPDPAALRRMILEPARLAGQTFQERGGKSLADVILDDALGHRELLPLVGQLLADLFGRCEGGVLTFDQYEQLGGVQGALERSADEALRSVPDHEQAALGAVLDRLVTVSGNDEGVFVKERPVLAAFQTEAELHLVHALIRARLCTAGEESAPTVTLAHEAILRIWGPARRWVESNRDFLRLRARLESRRTQGSYLLEGDPLLEAAVQALRDSRGRFTQQQQDFVDESARRVADARGARERARRRTVLALSALCVVGVVLAGIAWSLKRGADREAAASYVKAGLLELAQDRFRTGAALLAKAVTLADHRAARVRLLSALARTPWWIPAVPTYGTVVSEESIEWSPDGKKLLWAQQPAVGRDEGQAPAEKEVDPDEIANSPWDWFVADVVAGVPLAPRCILRGTRDVLTFSADGTLLVAYRMVPVATGEAEDEEESDDEEVQQEVQRITGAFRLDGGTAVDLPKDLRLSTKSEGLAKVRDQAALVLRRSVTSARVTLRTSARIDAVTASRNGAFAVTNGDVDSQYSPISVWSTGDAKTILQMVTTLAGIEFSPSGEFLGLKKWPDGFDREGYWDVYRLQHGRAVRGPWELLRDPLEVSELVFDPTGEHVAIGVWGEGMLIDEVADPYRGAPALHEGELVETESDHDPPIPDGSAEAPLEPGKLWWGDCDIDGGHITTPRNDGLGVRELMKHNSARDRVDVRSRIGPGVVERCWWSASRRTMVLMIKFPWRTWVLDTSSLAALDSFGSDPDQFDDTDRLAAWWLSEFDLDALSDGDLLQVTEVLAGATVATDGTVREVPRSTRIEKRRQILAREEGTFQNRVARWLVSPRHRRGPIPMKSPNESRP